MDEHTAYAAGYTLGQAATTANMPLPPAVIREVDEWWDAWERGYSDGHDNRP